LLLIHGATQGQSNIRAAQLSGSFLALVIAKPPRGVLGRITIEVKRIVRALVPGGRVATLTVRRRYYGLALQWRQA